MSSPSLAETGTPALPLLGDPLAIAGVRFAFTSRLGGVSKGPYASLNLGERVGDDPDAVAENRRRAIAALRRPDDAPVDDLASRLLCPRQVHGRKVLLVDDASPAALERLSSELSEGADGIVLTVSVVPALICTADCVPVVLAAEGAVAVVHSGWRGTLSRICAEALDMMRRATGVASEDVRAYLGPHILGSDYEVSGELLATFVDAFGSRVRAGERHLSLADAVAVTLAEEGVPDGSIATADVSTLSAADRYFSHRATGSPSGRQGAIAWLT